MHTSDLAMMLLSFSCGAGITTWLHAYVYSRDIERNAQAAVQAVRRTAGDRYWASLDLYRIQHDLGLVP
ncbi:hypothetical protein [Streptomyces sp. NPDC101249]|uniref:hypothetical protein n=1 Tax=Streptomyces sp. NPDC101249 TaxID=3366140 RepID=UPI00382A95FE